MRVKMNDKDRNIIKDKILNCTRIIVENEGFDGVSIRKVATLANYTPGSIYQYFENKDTLIRELVQQGYKKIVQSILIEIDENKTVEEEIRIRFSSYINTALKMPKYYKAVMLSEDKKILEKTAILNSKSENDNRLIYGLEKLLIRGIKTKEFDKFDALNQAKCIWMSTFGLIIRLIIEKQTDQKIINKYIDNHFYLIFNGLKGGN